MRYSTLVQGLVTAVLGCLAPLGVQSTAGHPQAHWVWPLDPVPRVVRGFEPPGSPYGPGHRGVDLAGSVGQPVLAIGDGTVTFAGSVDGRGVVVVDHGRLRSTYQPVAADVPVGAAVRAGRQLGTLELVHSHCLPAACLHLGVRLATTYLDPLRLLGPRPVRLLPLGGLTGDALRWLPPAPPPGGWQARAEPGPGPPAGGVATSFPPGADIRGRCSLVAPG